MDTHKMSPVMLLRRDGVGAYGRTAQPAALHHGTKSCGLIKLSCGLRPFYGGTPTS